MKKLQKRLLCICMLCGIYLFSQKQMLLLANAQQEVSSATTQAIGMPNPITSYDTIKQLKEAISFSLYLPKKLPKGYVRKEQSTIAKTTAQVFYRKGKSEILFRTAKSSKLKDISGDYTKYKQIEKKKMGSVKVTIKGEKDLVSLALWQQHGCVYSLSFSSPVKQSTVKTIVTSLKKQ